MNTRTPATPWRLLAAIFGALFLMSGVDGQQRVQAVFLLIAFGCLAVDALLPTLRQWWAQWRAAQPGARISLGTARDW